MSRRKAPLTVALAAILLLGAALRFYGITDRGVFDYDEAWGLLEAKTVYYAGRFALAKAGIGDDRDTGVGLRDYVKQRGTVPITHHKPGHRAFVFLSMLLWGPRDYAALIVSAVAGVFTIFLVFRSCAFLFGPIAGCLAALYLAISPLNLHYSRSGYSTALAVCFVALAFWFWTRYCCDGRLSHRPLILCGFAVGWAFTCHPNTAWIPPAFLVLVIYAIRQHGGNCRSIWAKARHPVILSAAMAAPLALFEGIDRFAQSLGAFPKDYPTYIGQFIVRKQQIRELEISSEPFRFWLERLHELDGIPMLIFLSLGLAVLIWRLRGRRTEHVGTLLLFVVTIVPVSLLMTKGLYILRNYALTVLPLSLLFALGATWLLDCVRLIPQVGRVLLLSCAGTALAVSGYLGIRDLLPVRSTYRDAVSLTLDHVKREGGRISTRPPSAWPIWYFYLSEAYDTEAPEIRSRIRFYPDSIQDGDYELIDVKRYLRAALNGDHESLECYSSIGSRGLPVVRVANPASLLPSRFTESGGPHVRSTWELLASSYPAYRSIQVYDLRRLREL